ncbi:hypothetical protein [Paenibacillus harenae]|uniref:hypothetical protein n=1 Tax=Paenibacillus harenae TaxID=306543 RepID=UPI0004047600|nr:hypothetical protein [Paenibacillus harenae]
MKKLVLFIMMILLLSACGGMTSRDGNGTGNGTGNGNENTNTSTNTESDTNTNKNTNTNPDTSQPSPTSAPTPAPSPEVADTGEEEDDPAPAATAQEAAAAVMLALKDGDMIELAEYAHPDKGLLFSPYAHIDTATAKVFPAAGLPGMSDETVYSWGSFDGSGEPIELTFKQYYEKFVYDQDFMEPDEVGVNEIKGTGNAAVNIQEVFPEGFLMDYYFSGFNAQYEGMDWESLILVLEESNGAWFVSAIVHSQWTI